MTRATNAPARHRRRNKLFARTKGFRGARKNIYRVARNAAFKAGQHAYADRRRRRRLFRRLWVARINAAAREYGLPYNKLMRGLARAGIALDRKALATLAVESPAAFKTLVASAHQALQAES